MSHERYEVRPIGTVYGVWDGLQHRFVLFAVADDIATLLRHRLEARWMRQVQHYRNQEHEVWE